MTTKSPDEVASQLRGYLADEYKTKTEVLKFLIPFNDAGWEQYGDLVLKKEIRSPVDSNPVRFYAQYWASYDEPISVQFDQVGTTQWFANAEDAIKFTDKVISELRKQSA